MLCGVIFTYISFHVQPFSYLIFNTVRVCNVLLRHQEPFEGLKQLTQVLLRAGADGSLENSVGISANHIMDGDHEEHAEKNFDDERSSNESEWEASWRDKLRDNGSWQCEHDEGE